ncbi:MAG: glycosyltransferase [Granulosicoccus sp.]
MVRALTDKFRRRIEQRLDQAAALLYRQCFKHNTISAYDGDTRLAIVSVNYSTLRWLKLMLLTLTEQNELSRITDIIIVDNSSRDGSRKFLKELNQAVSAVTVVENNWFLNHARGMRSGLKALANRQSAANVVLSVDTDVIFLRNDTLQAVATRFEEGTTLLGEMRYGLYEVPEAQASFIAVRRDIMARPDILPWVNHGAPSYWMQKSIREAGLSVCDFPSNQEGYILHRGRAGVAAAREFHPGASYGSATNTMPHFMGIPEGKSIWKNAEQRWTQYLDDDALCIEHLEQRLSIHPEY